MHKRLAHNLRNEKKCFERGKLRSELEEVMPPARSKKHPSFQPNEKQTSDRCCYASPEQRDFGNLHQALGHMDEANDEYAKYLLKHGLDTSAPSSPTKLTKNTCSSTNKIDYNSRSINTELKAQISAYAETSNNGSKQWLNIDNVDDVEKYLILDKTDNCESPIMLPKDVYISDVPRIKIIAEKFSKLKKNDMEFRKLDEKIVCIEYDVYDKPMAETDKPIQIMRAYFSVKPKSDSESGTKERPIVQDIISGIKHKLNITEDDKKTFKKEIEMIDDKLSENKGYLADLRRVLKRNQAIYSRRNKTSLDLQSLFEMAKRDSPILDEDFSNTNFLSKAELDEVKDIILKSCVSSNRGINRRKVKESDVSDKIKCNIGVISPSFVNELLRDDEC